MEYIRINKNGCVVKMEKEKWGFDFNKELVQYKYLTGEKMSAREWRTMEKLEKFNSYYKWDESIKNRNTEKTKKELEEFERHLNNRINMEKPTKELYLIIGAAVIGAMVTLIFEHLDVLDKLQIPGNIFMSLILVLVVVIFVTVGIVAIMFNVSMPIWTTHSKIAFLNEYHRVIKKILEERDLNNK